MRRLRSVASREDRPLSELIRRATERWLDSIPEAPAERGSHRIPLFHGGRVRVKPGALRQASYDDRTPTATPGTHE
jgi:hypothetical protein